MMCSPILAITGVLFARNQTACACWLKKDALSAERIPLADLYAALKCVATTISLRIIFSAVGCVSACVAACTSKS